MITITDIRKLGNTAQRKQLEKLRQAKRRTASANKTLNRDNFSLCSESRLEHYYMIQELASSDYMKALEEFAAYFQISADEAATIANKIRIK